MSTPPEPTTPPAAALPPITAADAGGEFSAADAAGVVAALKSPSIRGKLAQLEKLGLDGYQNVLTALGVPGKDSGQADRVVFDRVLTLDDIDALYTSDFIAGRTVDEPAADSVRRGLVFTSDDPGFAKAIDAEFKRTGALLSLRELVRLDRKDGGGALLIAAEDGAGDKLDQPLDKGSLKRFARLIPIERISLKAEGQAIDSDPFSPNYGHPIVWHVEMIGPMGQPIRTPVHWSRLIVWRGLPVPRNSRYRAGQTANMIDQWGGYSVLQRVAGPLKSYRTLWGYIESTFKRFSLIILKVSGLAKLISENEESVVIKRLELISLAMSALKVLPIDEHEDMAELATTLAGVAEILLRLQDNVGGATGLPLTKVFAHTPAGFSSDDEPGKRNYEALVGDIRTRLGPEVERIVEIITLCSDGPFAGVEPEEWSHEWPPIEEPTQEEVDRHITSVIDNGGKLVLARAMSEDELRQSVAAVRGQPFVLPEETPAPGEDDDPADNGPPTPDPDPAPGEGGKFFS